MSPELQRAELMASYLREIRERIEKASLANASSEDRVTVLRHLSIARKLCDAAIGQDDESIRLAARSIA